MALTPGVRFLARAFLRLSFTLAAVATLQRMGNYFEFPVRAWILAVTFVLGAPLAFTVHILWAEYSLKTRAASLGARLAPRVEGKSFGNLDIARTLLRNWREGYPGDGLTDMMLEKGPVFDVRALWRSSIFTTQPEHIQLILASDFTNYVKGAKFQYAMDAVLGTGVFNADGAMWKFHRAMTRPFFTRDRISHFDLFDRHAEQAITQMKLRLREGLAVDFQDLMSRFTLDSATEFLFGSCVHSLSAGLPYAHAVRPAPVNPESPTRRATTANEFSEAFLEAQQVIARRERLNHMWPLFEILKDSAAGPMQKVNGYIEPIVNEALRKKKAQPQGLQKEKTEIGENETLLDHLVHLTSDKTVLKDEILNIMIAGRDTTAATLTFIVYFLSMYPNVAVRLREEVLSKVGPSGRPTYDDVKEMRYLRAVINETLRLYPVVPFNVRHSVNETTWPSPDPNEKPIYIPANTSVPYSVFMMHRRTDLWGPDAEEFDPDRFLDERLKKYLTPRPFIFLPFNAGPRICLGQQFAYNEMSFMLVRLMQSFSSFSLDLSSCPPAFRPPSAWKGAPGRKGVDQFFPKLTLTMYSAGGLWLKAVEAET